MKTLAVGIYATPITCLPPPLPRVATAVKPAPGAAVAGRPLVPKPLPAAASGDDLADFDGDVALRDAYRRAVAQGRVRIFGRRTPQ